jgi:hypothetical protein
MIMGGRACAIPKGKKKASAMMLDGESNISSAPAMKPATINIETNQIQLGENFFI